MVDKETQEGFALIDQAVRSSGTFVPSNLQGYVNKALYKVESTHLVDFLSCLPGRAEMEMISC